MQVCGVFNNTQWVSSPCSHREYFSIEQSHHRRPVECKIPRKPFNWLSVSLVQLRGLPGRKSKFTLTSHTFHTLALDRLFIAPCLRFHRTYFLLCLFSSCVPQASLQALLLYFVHLHFCICVRRRLRRQQHQSHRLCRIQTISILRTTTMMKLKMNLSRTSSVPPMASSTGVQ